MHPSGETSQRLEAPAITESSAKPAGRLAALTPAALLALFSCWSGTYVSGASAIASSVGWLLLLTIVAVGWRGASWRELADPLALAPLLTGPSDAGIETAGRPWHAAKRNIAAAAPWGIVGLALLSWLASPVARAGQSAVLLLPMFLLVPRALARGLRSAADRRLAHTAVAVACVGIAAWAMIDLFVHRDPTGGLLANRTAMPLGHHNLLATVLVLLLPLVALPAWRAGGARGWWLGGFALCASALLATRSLAGLAGLLTQLSVFAWNAWVKRSSDTDAVSFEHTNGNRPRPGQRPRLTRRLLALAVGLTLGVTLGWLFAPRIQAIKTGSDSSLAARTSYLAAGWSGALERPWLGWGPGATPWTYALHVAPKPGVNPPGELVGDLHNSLLGALYELGALGLGLQLIVFGLLLRTRDDQLTQSPTFQATRLALLGAAVTSLGGLPLAISALPVALVVVLALRVATVEPAEATPVQLAGPQPGRLLAAAALAVAAGLAPGQLAAWHAERAAFVGRPWANAEQGPQPAALAVARRLDPRNPLFVLRAAATGTATPSQLAAASDQAPGIAALALTAGIANLPALDTSSRPLSSDRRGQTATSAALFERACRLDPFDALAPFNRALLEPTDALAASRAARAFAASPSLAAAVDWRSYPELRRLAVARLTAEAGLDPGWREAFLAAAAAVEAGLQATQSVAELAAVIDREPSSALSLQLFRRLPVPTTLARVALAEPGALARLPAATTLTTTSAEIFGPACTLRETPTRLSQTRPGLRGPAYAARPQNPHVGWNSLRQKGFRLPPESPQKLWKNLSRTYL